MISRLSPYSCLNTQALTLLAEAAACVKVPGSIVECGVANGGSAMWLWHVLGRNRHLWLYDSWQGLPKPDPILDGGRACSKYEHKLATHGAMCKGEITIVLKAANEVGIPLDLLHFVPGWFVETMPKTHMEPGQIALLHMDSDWYESTLIPLYHFWPHVAIGGAVIFDDYGAWHGAKSAADEFALVNGLDLEVIGAKARIIKHGD